MCSLRSQRLKRVGRLGLWMCSTTVLQRKAPPRGRRSLSLESLTTPMARIYETTGSARLAKSSPNGPTAANGQFVAAVTLVAPKRMTGVGLVTWPVACMMTPPIHTT